jgi:hypothetical protein
MVGEIYAASLYTRRTLRTASSWPALKEHPNGHQPVTRRELGLGVDHHSRAAGLPAAIRLVVGIPDRHVAAFFQPVRDSPKIPAVLDPFKEAPALDALRSVLATNSAGGYAGNLRQADGGRIAEPIERIGELGLLWRLASLTESYFVNQLLLRIKQLPRLTSAED